MSTEGRGPGDPLRGGGQPPEPAAPGVGALTPPAGDGLAPRPTFARVLAHLLPEPLRASLRASLRFCPDCERRGSSGKTEPAAGSGWPHPGLDFSTSP